MNGPDLELRVRPVPPEQWREALALLHHHLELGIRATVIHDALQAGALSLPPYSGLFEATRDHRRVGVVHSQLQAGRVAVVDPPALVADEPASTALRLLASVDDYLSQSQVSLAQSLVVSSAVFATQVLPSAGYVRAGELLYLLSLQEGPRREAPPTRLDFQASPGWSDEELASLIEATYQDSLDLPLLNERRCIRDVLESYERTGNSGRALWRRIVWRDAAVGCLFVTRHSGGFAELIYMGLVPSARGHGFGHEVVQHAQWLASESGCSQLFVGVDAANHAAIFPYVRAGFFEYDRRAVWLKFF